MKNNQTEKSKKSFLIALLFVATAMTAQAQDYAFKVLATNGSVNKGAARIWSGSTLAGNDVINVGANSYVGLMHKGGKTLEIKQAGSYKVSELNAKIGAANSTNSAKYANYVAGEMTKADRQDINKNHRKYMAITGSVERAFLDDALVVVKYGNTKDKESSNTNVTGVINNTFILRIYKNPILPKVATDYTIVVSDFYGKEVLKKTLNLSDKSEDIVEITIPNMKEDIAYIVDVVPSSAKKNIARNTTSVELVRSGDKYTAVKNALADFKTAEPTALNYMLQAGIYEQEGFLLDATTCYEKAMALEPKVQTYQISYQDFVARNGLRWIADGKDLKPMTINTQVSEDELMKEGGSKIDTKTEVAPKAEIKKNKKTKTK